MDDETLRKKISLIRWVAIIALIASFVSYLFPYFSAAAFGVGVQISGINMISLAFGALPGTSFGDTLSILLYIAPLVFGVVAGIALWAYYYRACAVFSFLAGGAPCCCPCYSPHLLCISLLFCPTRSFIHAVWLWLVAWDVRNFHLCWGSALDFTAVVTKGEIF